MSICIQPGPSDAHLGVHEEATALRVSVVKEVLRHSFPRRADEHGPATLSLSFALVATLSLTGRPAMDASTVAREGYMILNGAQVAGFILPRNESTDLPRHN